MKNLLRSNQAVVERIHREFDTAADKLYEEAERIINEIKISDVEKATRLHKLGFTASGEVRELKEKVEKKTEKEVQMRLVKYYRENYPLQKFITENQVTEICKKYGLVIGKADRFKGFVPESKLELMEKFVLKKEDAMYEIIRSWGTERYGYESVKSFSDGFGHTHIDKTFRVVAPKTDFEMDSTIEEIKNYRIIRKPVQDPVVLACVNGGYLVVAAWGPEASDPIIVNDKNN